MKNYQAKSPKISVLIPTRNGAGTLTELFAMLSIQSIAIEEVIIADSASNDDTVLVAERNGAVVIPVEQAKFDHGGTRSLLAQQARGDFLIFLSQDVIPKRRNSIEKLLEPLLGDTSIAISYGRQLPSFDADYFASNLRSFNYPAQSEVRELKEKERLGLKAVFSSNAFACYRKSSLVTIGYFKDKLILGEDTVAAGRLLINGEKIAYAADAVVYHSHNYSPLEELKRYFDIGVLHTQEQWLLDTFGGAEGQGFRYCRREFLSLREKKMFHLLPELFIRIFMKYCGYNLGRHYKLLPKKYPPCFSMHRSWWHSSTDAN